MNFRLPLTDTKEDGMTAVMEKPIAELAPIVTWADLNAEYVALAACRDEFAIARGLSKLAAVAIARVAVLEAGR